MNKSQFISAVLLALILASPVAMGNGVEHVPVSNPVYQFLERQQVLGNLESKSLALLPLSRNAVVALLTTVKQSHNVSETDQHIATEYLTYLSSKPSERAVLVSSDSDSAGLFAHLVDSDTRLLFYASQDSTHRIEIEPLASAEFRFQDTDSSRNVVLGQAGMRLAGSVENTVGYLLQVTNGAVLSGSRTLALQDPRLGRNVKFGDLNSDFDFTESHVVADFDWLRIGLGRETRLWGNGYVDRLYIGNGAAPLDGLEVGVRFENFSYRYMHAAALGISESQWTFGPEADIPQKHVVTHRFAVEGDWGEVGFQESIVYSERSFDLAYLNPLSFFKSVEHSLRDRDNSLIGVDATVRPLPGLQLRGQWILDDLIFDSIGTDYWGNKTAWTLGAMWSTDFAVDIALEYQRHEPFVFSHFNIQNSVTNDEAPIAGSLQPNSERTTAFVRYWLSELPIELRGWVLSHGKNVYEGDSLVVNAGGDILQTRRSEDPTGAPFLGGILEREVGIEISGGYRVLPSVFIHGAIRWFERNGVTGNSGRFGLQMHFF